MPATGSIAWCFLSLLFIQYCSYTVVTVYGGDRVVDECVTTLKRWQSAVPNTRMAISGILRYANSNNKYANWSDYDLDQLRNRDKLSSTFQKFDVLNAKSSYFVDYVALQSSSPDIDLASKYSITRDRVAKVGEFELHIHQVQQSTEPGVPVLFIEPSSSEITIAGESNAIFLGFVNFFASEVKLNVLDSWVNCKDWKLEASENRRGLVTITSNSLPEAPELTFGDIGGNRGLRLKKAKLSGDILKLGRKGVCLNEYEFEFGPISDYIPTKITAKERLRNGEGAMYLENTLTLQSVAIAAPFAAYGDVISDIADGTPCQVGDLPGIEFEWRDGDVIPRNRQPGTLRRK